MKHQRIAVVLIFGVAGLALLVPVFAYQFTHIDETELRVFVETWPYTVGAFGCFVVAGLAGER